MKKFNELDDCPLSNRRKSRRPKKIKKYWCDCDYIVTDKSKCPVCNKNNRKGRDKK